MSGEFSQNGGARQASFGEASKTGRNFHTSQADRMKGAEGLALLYRFQEERLLAG